ncbi:MAG: ABC transporter permease [Bacteroidetes bacterium]|nr:ABC transporter permease [Bacteroidota bacterium]
MKSFSAIRHIFGFQLQDALRSRWLTLHTLVYLCISEGLLLSTGFADKTLVSLINVVLFLVPLIALVFGVIHQYNNRDYTVWMLTQPVERRHLFSGLFLGLTVPMMASFGLGLGLPFLWHGGLAGGQMLRLATLVGLGSVLILVGTGVATILSIRFSDRVKGIGLVLIFWMGFALLFDGLVLLGVSAFAQWPVEKALLGAMLLNPIDLARLILLQTFDAAAMLGYTGAVFTRFFGSAMGLILATGALVLWAVTPTWSALRLFNRQDF